MKKMPLIAALILSGACAVAANADNASTTTTATNVNTATGKPTEQTETTTTTVVEKPAADGSVQIQMKIDDQQAQATQGADHNKIDSATQGSTSNTVPH